MFLFLLYPSNKKDKEYFNIQCKIQLDLPGYPAWSASPPRSWPAPSSPPRRTSCRRWSTARRPRQTSGSGTGAGGGTPVGIIRLKGRRTETYSGHALD